MLCFIVGDLEPVVVEGAWKRGGGGLLCTGIGGDGRRSCLEGCEADADIDCEVDGPLLDVGERVQHVDPRFQCAAFAWVGHFPGRERMEVSTWWFVGRLDGARADGHGVVGLLARGKEGEELCCEFDLLLRIGGVEDVNTPVTDCGIIPQGVQFGDGYSIPTGIYDICCWIGAMLELDLFADRCQTCQSHALLAIEFQYEVIALYSYGKYASLDAIA